MTFITDIDPSDPAFNAPAGEGDDQIRAFKADVQQSFPNISGAVTATQEQLNLTINLFDDLALKAPLEAPAFTTSIAIGAAVVDETELEILDGATIITSTLNILGGYTGSTVELNKLDGLTPTTTELNHVDGVTSAIQAQFTGKAAVAGNTGQVFSIASAGSVLTRAIRRTDRATPTLDGTIRVRVSGTDLFMTNDDSDP